jgi:oxysterol-binding protein 1
MFPRMSNSDKDVPVNEGRAAAVGERLRQRLQEEGVSETVIIDCERLVREEFAALQRQLTLLKHRHARLVDTLRHLEVRFFLHLLCKIILAILGWL